MLISDPKSRPSFPPPPPTSEVVGHDGSYSFTVTARPEVLNIRFLASDSFHLVMACVTGWRGVCDPDGNPLEFNQANLCHVLLENKFLIPLIKAEVESLRAINDLAESMKSVG